MKKQAGFTLMELVIVIVVLGILAAVAIPNYIDLEGKAGEAGAAGVAGSLSSASAINLAACKAGLTECVAIAETGSDCSTLAGSLLTGGLPSGYTTTGSPTFSGGVGSCVITNTQSEKTATATIHQTVTGS